LCAKCAPRSTLLALAPTRNAWPIRRAAKLVNLFVPIPPPFSMSHVQLCSNSFHQ
jgi:hypothetical protein